MTRALKAAAVLATACAASAYGMGETDLSDIITPGTEPVAIVQGMKFTEGPAWSREGRLLFSDIPDNVIYEWTPGEGGGDGAEVKPRAWRKPSNHSNGLIFDAQGRLLAAEHGGRVTRTEADGSVKVLAESFEGKRLSSPNDLCVGREGSVYFTDPTYGLRPPLGGEVRQREAEFNGVYRIAPDGSVSVVARDMRAPNGIALSPDGKRLYVADTQAGEIRIFDVAADGSVSAGRHFADVKGDNGRSAGPDGVRTDRDGRVYCAGRGGVWVFDAEGRKLGVIGIPQGASNLCFGGAEGKTLFVTSGARVFRIDLKARGAGF